MTVGTILQLLKMHKLRHTEKREGLIRIFRDSEREFELHEIIQEMRQRYPNVRHQTIVSNLEALVEAGLLVKTKHYSVVTFALSQQKAS